MKPKASRGLKKWKDSGIDLMDLDEVSKLSVGNIDKKDPFVAMSLLLMDDIALCVREHSLARPAPNETAYALRQRVQEIMYRNYEMWDMATDDISRYSNMASIVVPWVMHVMDKFLANEADSSHNWTEVEVIYAFGAFMVNFCQNQGLESQIAGVKYVITLYICTRLANWIKNNGGWESYAKYATEYPSHGGKRWKHVNLYIFFSLSLLSGLMVAMALRA